MPPPRTTDSVLQLYELSGTHVKAIVDKIFQDSEARWPAGGSLFQRWYRQNASVSTSVRDDQDRRLIAWKSDTPFSPENLFFRTVDTNRLLPMALADFRLQIWAHPSVWERLDQQGARVHWATGTVASMIHDLLLLRNMHDQGGADIPIIAVNWEDETMDRALDYWVGLSRGQWSEAERQVNYDSAGDFCRRLLPCFLQADLLVRALYSDPAVGYVPPFIILMPLTTNVKARVLFTKRCHMLPQAFAQSWPSYCGNPGCADSDCGMIDFTKSRCLADGTAMVREGSYLPHRVVCNLWGCEKRSVQAGGDAHMMRCQRCKEVIYCEQVHQRLDWFQHRKVCEGRT